ncbi:cupin domain-containing protein [Nocardia sp. NPDC051570]|uniref:cupin domain-containing protein n=1 Tax=Nocardia sp. NPDC051570 TaxID=3364324 RepID=UPI00379886A1
MERMEFRPNPAPATHTRSRLLLRLRMFRWEVVLRQTIIEPGGDSGWHYHDGTLYVLVTGGGLDHPGIDCVPVVHRPGRIFREPSGPNHAHLARNSGTKPLMLTVVYLNPAGSALSRSVPPPKCAEAV